METLIDNAQHRKVIDKLEKYQDKLIPVLEELEASGQMPEDLKRAFDVIDDGGTELGDYVALSDALFTYQGMFPEHVREHIARYREEVQELFQMDEGLQTPNAYDPL